MDFKAWLSVELAKREWSQRKFALKSGISQALVSMVLAGDAKPTADFCTKAAQALNESPEKVLRIAELLPPTDENDPALIEILDIVRTLSPQQREQLLEFARFLRQKG
jgi:transcriptional regulator with XRE-family HTH domain